MKQLHNNPPIFPCLLALSFLAFIAGTTPVAAQCALVCKGSVEIPIDASGTATVAPPDFLQSAVGCSNDFEMTIVDTLGNEYGPVLSDTLMGQPLVATILHPPSGNSCSSEITLVDITPPEIACGSDTIYTWCNVSPDSLPQPAVSDNVTDTADIAITYQDTYTELPCFDTVNQVPANAWFARTWYATDESANTDSCTQVFIVKRATVAMVEFPAHRDGTSAPALECAEDDPSDLSATGQPEIDGYVLDNTTSCDLLVSYTDQNIPTCGGARKLIRTWTVFDLCTEDFRVFSQVIRILDTTAPELTCPGNVTVSSYSNSCEGQVLLPAAVADDACSGVTVEPAWSFGNGYGPYNNIPVGTHTVTYRATDGCNNTIQCEITVSVKDNKKPTAICQNLVTGNLEQDGTLLIFANSFDNGSYDNCGIAELAVSLGDQQFDEFVSFECDDLGLTIPITLRVTDVHGLESMCQSAARVLDPIEPDILCPAAKTINCGVNYNNPINTGLPYATDNCTVTATTFTNQLQLNSCGMGTILRTWTATDQSNNSSSCQQTITIVDGTPISVVFPDDLQFYKCQPDTDPAITGEPVVTGSDCEQLQITHTDYLFYTAEPSCYKLIRNWAVINWCVYIPNDPDNTGFWGHTQVIEIRDTIPPIVTCPPPTTVNIAGSSCSAFANVPGPEVADCSQEITIVNDSPFAQSVGGVANGVYPQGVHLITYTAFDGCGNSASCTMQLTVKDAQAPQPVCNNGVSVTIQPGGYVTITPSMINNGSFDNCSPSPALVLQVSPNTFDCQSVGSKKVTLTITDQSGNSSFCETVVNVQDNHTVCSGQGTITIAGKLETKASQPLSNKVVGLTGGINIAVHTDQDGTFDFPNLPPALDYTLKPEYDKNHVNGVTTFDMVIVRRHILNVDLLDTPYDLIAADVNNSKSVTTLDLVDMQKLILNVTSKFPNGNKSWRFIPASYVFPNPKNPWEEVFPESLVYADVETNQWNQNFYGIKIGDVNGSASGGSFNEEIPDERTYTDYLTFTTDDIELEAGKEYAIPFVAQASEPIAGFQFTFEYDPAALELSGAHSDAPHFDPEQNLGTILEREGMLTLGWINEVEAPLRSESPFIILRFTARQNASLSQVLAIGSGVIPAEAVGGRLSATDTPLTPIGVRLAFNGQAAERQVHLYQNTPNPFRYQTTLRFYLPEEAPVRLEVFDLYGRIVKAIEGHFPEGEHEVPLDLQGKAAEGMLLCHLRLPGGESRVIRMLRSDTR